MATVTAGTTGALDFRTLNIAGLVTGTPSSASASRFTVDYGNGTRDEFAGLGFFSFDDKGFFQNGTVTGLQKYVAGNLIVSFDGAFLPVDNFMALVKAGDNEGALLQLLLFEDQINGSAQADYLNGGGRADTISALGGNDTLIGGADNDILDGGAGTDTAVYRGTKADYTITRNADGSYAIVDKVDGRDGTDTVANVELLQFSDQTFLLTTDLPFPALFAANLSQAKAISAAYQVLLGGVPGISGYEFLIKGNLASNFGAGAGPVFNDENIFINVANSLVQGNPTAAAAFNTLAAGATLADKITSLYTKIIPAAKQNADGLAFLIRPDGLKFYQDVARERGITAENGPAVTALASLLKIAVDGKSGIGNPVSDLIATIADGSAGLPATSQVVLPIETIDGIRFDADDAPDAMPGFSGPAPAPVPVIGLAEASYEAAGF